MCGMLGGVVVVCSVVVRLCSHPGVMTVNGDGCGVVE